MGVMTQNYLETLLHEPGPTVPFGFSRRFCCCLPIVAAFWTTTLNADPAPNKEIKFYSKSELALKLPANPVTGFGSKLYKEVSAVLNRVAVTQASEGQLAHFKALETKQYDKHDWALSISSLSQNTDSNVRANTAAVYETMAVNTQNAIGDHVSGQFKFMREISRGLKFNLDLDRSREAQPSSKPGQDIRYGLKLKAIIPDANAMAHASLSEGFSDMSTAGKAYVKWTIAELEDDIEVKRVRDFSPSRDEETGRSQVRLPKAAFAGNVVPRALDRWATGAPEFRANFYQVEGFYNYLFELTDGGKRTVIEHSFRIPVIDKTSSDHGALTFGQSYNEAFRPIKTSLFSVLAMAKGSSLDLHYLNQEKKIISAAQHRFQTHRIGLSATSAGNERSPEDQRLESYDINYGREF